MYLEPIYAASVEARTMGMALKMLERWIIDESLVESSMALYDLSTPSPAINLIITSIYAAFFSPSFF